MAFFVIFELCFPFSINYVTFLEVALSYPFVKQVFSNAVVIKPLFPKSATSFINYPNVVVNHFSAFPWNSELLSEKSKQRKYFATINILSRMKRKQKMCLNVPGANPIK